MEDYTNDALEQEVVDPATEKSTKIADVEDKNEATTKQEAADPAKPVQDAETNAAFAKLRRKAEEAEQKSRRLEILAETYKNGVKNLGYDGETHEDIAAALIAESQGITKEQAKAQLKTREQDIISAERERQLIFENDALKLRLAYPELKINSTEELGEEFIALMSTNKYTLEKAYATIKAAGRK